MTNTSRQFAVLGAGSWGTALAILLANNGYPTSLWGHEPDHIDSLNKHRENQQFLPGVILPDTLTPQVSLADAVTNATDVMLVVPSHCFREVLEQARQYFAPTAQLSWATKGLDPHSHNLLHHVADELVGDTTYAVISGPSFANEVARGMPTALVVAARELEYAKQLSACLSNNRFRAYTNQDIIGVQLGGAVKNVLAVAAGISDGLGFGANARAALITRGLHEMLRLGVALGGESETFMGLAGLGDLVLTCTDDQSRNRRFGLALGQGESIETAQINIGQVVEGVKTTAEIHQLAEQYQVEMPITEQIYQVLYQSLTPTEAVNALFARALRAE